LKGFTTDGLEQLLWHITAIEAVLGQRVDAGLTKPTAQSHLNDSRTRNEGEAQVVVCAFTILLIVLAPRSCLWLTARGSHGPLFVVLHYV
jgi:hypothetical protein